MRPAPHRLVGRLAGLVAALSAASVLSACGSAADTLSQRNLSVIFEDDHTQADVALVRQHCDGVGGAKAMPAGPDNATTRRYPLRFDVSGLNRDARAELVACLDDEPSVRGYQDSESARG